MPDKVKVFNVVYKTCSHTEVLNKCTAVSLGEHWVSGTNEEGNRFFIPTSSVVIVYEFN